MDNRNYDGILWYKTTKGYWTNNKYGSQHRYIYEKLTGLKVFDYQVVHHLDGDPSNNIAENLVCMTKSDHSYLHNILSNKGKRFGEANKGKKYSNNHKRKLSESHFGKRMSEYTKNKMRISVQNIETGEIFNGILKAANSIGVPRQAICGAIRRKGKSGGYHWQYLDNLTRGELVMKGEQL